MDKSRERDYFTPEDINILSEISNSILVNLNFDVLLQKSIDVVVDKLKLLGGILFIVDEKFLYAKTIAKGQKASKFLELIGKPISDLKIDINEQHNNFVVNAVLTKKDQFSFNLIDFTRKVLGTGVTKLARTITRTKACISIPLLYHNNAIGALFFSKSEKKNFSKELPMLKLLSNQIAIAITNARLYEQSQQQIQELASKNEQLQTILDTTNSIVSTLDPKEVTQTAVNMLPSKQKCLAAFVTIVNEEKNELGILAFTETETSNSILNLVGEDLTEFKVSMDDPDLESTLLMRTLKNETLEVSASFKDVMTPPVPEKIADSIQKVMKAESVLSIPMKRRGRVIGSIVYILENRTSDLTEEQKSFFQTLAFIIGIAVENARSFQDKEQAFQELAIATEKVKEKNEKLKRTSKREKDILEVISKQLLTPVATLKTTVNELRDFKEKADLKNNRCDEIVKKLDDATEKEYELINTLIGSTSIDKDEYFLSPKEFCLDDLIQDTVKEYQTRAKLKALKLTFVEPEEYMPDIKADQERMAQVISILVSNALEYTDKGSVKVWREFDSQKNKVSVYVKDTSDGMTQEEEALVSKEFLKLGSPNNKINGLKGISGPKETGLSLYLAGKILKLHNGWMNVKSKQGKGNTFWITLPLKSNIDKKYLKPKNNQQTK